METLHLDLEYPHTGMRAAAAVLDRFGLDADLAVWGLGVSGRMLRDGLQALGHRGRVVPVDRMFSDGDTDGVTPERLATLPPLSAVVVATGPAHYAGLARRLRDMGRTEPVVFLFSPVHGPGNRLAARGDLKAFAANYTAALEALTQRRTTVSHLPFFLYAEPSRNCNLRCVGCHDVKTHQVFPDMPLELFESLLAQVGPTTAHISLFRGGEAFSNPRFFDMLAVAARDTAADLHISSNLSFRFTPGQLRQLATACTMIDGAIDGLSPATYTIYRRGGRFDLAFGNLLRLAGLRDRLNKGLILRWRFVVFRHNEHEVPDARQAAEDMGIDLQFIKPFVPDPSWLPTDRSLWRQAPAVPAPREAAAPFSGLPCPWLYMGTIVNHDGSFSPCCERQEDWTPAGTPAAAFFNSEAYRRNRAAGVCPGCPPERLAEWRNAFASTVRCLATMLDSTGYAPASLAGLVASVLHE
jgi:pyruvate-formate lyase-activating enzyme